MSQENVEKVRKGMEAFNRERALSLEVVDPDVEFRGTGRLPDVGRVRGREAVAAWFDELFTAFEEVHIEPERFVDAGEAVVVPITQRVRGKGSGVEVTNRMVLVFRMPEGLITAFETYADEAKALEAVGLSEQDAHADS
jgi:ketosteroid isomerase-like protein